MELFPDRLTHGGPLDDWRRLGGFVERSVCGCCVRRANIYVYACVHICVCVCACVCVSESVLDEGFHVSSAVTVRTNASHVSPSMSMQEAPSTNTKETVY